MIQKKTVISGTLLSIHLPVAEVDDCRWVVGAAVMGPGCPCDRQGWVKDCARFPHAQVLLAESSYDRAPSRARRGRRGDQRAPESGAAPGGIRRPRRTRWPGRPPRGP